MKLRALFLIMAMTYTTFVVAGPCARDQGTDGQANVQWESLTNEEKIVLAQRAQERWAQLSPELKNALVHGSIERNLTQ